MFPRLGNAFDIIDFEIKSKKTEEESDLSLIIELVKSQLNGKNDFKDDKKNISF